MSECPKCAKLKERIRLDQQVIDGHSKRADENLDRLIDARREIERLTARIAVLQGGLP